MLWLACLFVIVLGWLSWNVASSYWADLKPSYRIGVITGLIIAIPWIACGEALGLRCMLISLQNPESIDWGTTGSMLTAVVGIPGIGIAVVLGVLEYQKWRENRKEIAGNEATQARKEEEPLDLEELVQPPEDSV